MITCSSCRTQEYEGELFCTNCGARLWGVAADAPATPTIAFDTSRLRDATRTMPSASPPVQQSLKPGQIAVAVPATSQLLLLEGQPEYVIGREGSATEIPDINLGPYGGRERGVSRKHAILRVDRRQLLLVDLGSSNGTWLNGAQLAPQEPIRLENGDELRLGRLVVKVFFNL